jgi:hypothetical protein
VGSSIGAQRAARSALPWNALERGSAKPGPWTVPVLAGVPASTQAVNVARSLPESRPTWGGASSAAMIGAVESAGSVAGAPDGLTHAMDEMKDVALHPPAGAS